MMHNIYWYLIVVVVATLISIFSYILTSKGNDNANLSTFECGFDAFDSSSEAYEVSFYVVGILFIVMDVEALFLYPWVSSWWLQGSGGVLGLLDFILELVGCLLLVWRWAIIS